MFEKKVGQISTNNIVGFIKRNQLFLIVSGISALIIIGYYSYDPSIVKNSQDIENEASQAIAQKDYQEAQKSYQVLADREPNNYIYQYNLAKTYHYQKDYQQAYQNYQQAYEIDQNRTDLLNLMANCQRELGDHNTAEELYREAISKSRRLSTYYLNLAAML